MSKLVFIAIVSAFVNNVVLMQGFGVNQLLTASQTMKDSLRLSVGILFITTVSSAIIWPLDNYVLVKYGFEFFRTFIFLFIIAAVVMLTLLILKRAIPKLYKSVGPILPLIAINSAVFGIILSNAELGYSFIRSMVNSVFASLGYVIVMLIMAGVRERIEYNDIPKPFEGMPILLITAGMMAVAFYGFIGLI